jgi:hypothetical protein
MTSQHHRRCDPTENSIRVTCPKAAHFERLTPALTVIIAGLLDSIACLLAIGPPKRQKKADLDTSRPSTGHRWKRGTAVGRPRELHARLFLQPVTGIDQEALEKHSGEARARDRLQAAVKI